MVFTVENVIKLARLTDNLGDILIKSGFGTMVDHLSQIRLAAERHDLEAFKKLVLSNELFGGSGALWEIWIEDKGNRIKFEKRFCEFADHLKSMGIENARMNQIIQGFK